MSLVGTQVWVVVTHPGVAKVVAVCNSEENAQEHLKGYIASAEDPVWEKQSGERENNNWIEVHFIEGPL